MKNSIKSNAAKFSARRMVKEYIDKFYVRGLEAAISKSLDQNTKH
jgi:hypothetical protein